MENPRSLLHLLRAVGNGVVLRRLLERFGDADAAVNAGRTAWREAGLTPAREASTGTPDPRDLVADLRWLEAPDHHLLAWGHPDYPALLREAPHPPAALFVAGDPMLLWHPQIAIVGTRKPTAGGRDRAGRFARAFTAAGFAVTSGLAEGVDAAAHAAALEGGRTVAVIGTGPDLAYPSRHGNLMARIAATGAVVSEHPPGTRARREHFPSRNRILAGLSLGTVVIEAALRSGALITARLAAESGREAFALPGSVDNPLARGCHRLLREGASLVETPDEVVAVLEPVATALAGRLRGALAPGGQPDSPSPLGPAPPGVAPALWRALGHDPVTLDQLAARTGLTLPQLAPMLLAMELDGRVLADQGRYARRP